MYIQREADPVFLVVGQVAVDLRSFHKKSDAALRKAAPGVRVERLEVLRMLCPVPVFPSFLMC